MYTNEILAKQQRLTAYLAAHQLDGVFLQNRANFAWITGGGDNHIVSSSESGVAAIFATPQKLICLTTVIESPRFRTEELAASGIEVIDYPWWDTERASQVVAEVLAGRKVASDTNVFGLPALPADFTKLRWVLTDAEILRYRRCGQIASSALEKVCRDVKVGETEFEIAARLEFEVQRTGANPCVMLVSTDRRVFDYRHPIPTVKKLEKYAMVVVCAEYRGLIASCTRFLHFGPLPADIRAKQQAVCNVDTAVNLATRPGRTIGAIFADLQNAYAQNGFADQWKLHHQGGSAGFAGREVIATPTSTAVVEANQAFAWNPSIAGTKSEDTVLITNKGMEILTSASASWPMVVGKCPAGELARPDILVR